MNISLFPNNIVNSINNINNINNSNIIVPRTKYTLRIKIDGDIPDFCAEYYMNKNNKYAGSHRDDSGFDLITPNDVQIDFLKVGKIDFKIKCEMVNNETGCNAPYYIYPRSSITNTNFMLANSVGIIDSNYRGNLQARLRNFSDDQSESVVKHMTKMVQICTVDLSPFTIQLASELSQSDRGEGGFGSTDRVVNS